jgi:hypothetical protein
MENYQNTPIDVSYSGGLMAVAPGEAREFSSMSAFLLRQDGWVTQPWAASGWADGASVDFYCFPFVF